MSENQDMANASPEVAARGDTTGAVENELRPRHRAGPPSTSLPTDLQSQAARRLHVVVALYAFAFFVSGPLTAALSPEDRTRFFGSALRWLPAMVSLAAALSVVGLTFSSRVRASQLLAIGLVFEVIGSFGIAAAQYLDVSRYTEVPPWGGLSWVAVWMLGFTVMIPSPPKHALAAALGSAAAVPAIVGLAVAIAPEPPPIGVVRFLMQIVVPYLIVVVIAYVGARVVYRLGTELKRARELGAYRLIEPLGFGGMGEVWRADHRLLARPAAVKLIRADPLRTGPAEMAELQARFEREAQALASLRSPHTTQLYDFGVADDGTFYCVMELLEGFDLQTLVERFGPVPPERAARLLAQVCHSLAEAHAAGLVHRDIKPSNLFLCRYGRDVDFVKVLDFGLVKPIIDGPPDVALTTEHQLRGTPAFMAPEQVLGVHSIDGRTDIYAVGCVAYWLVTGQVVFPGRSVMETVTKHAHESPTPPSQRSEFPIPAPFDRLILDCLAKDPAQRPADAATLMDAWSRLANGHGWSDAQAQTWWAHHGPRGFTESASSRATDPQTAA